MVGLFFNPQGRIASGPFWLGVIVLLVLGCVLSFVTTQMTVVRMAGDAPPSAFDPASLLLSLVGLLLLYPQLCIFGKRLHDAGKSAWWFLAVLAVRIVVGAGVGIALSLPYIPALSEATQGGDQVEAMRVQAAMLSALLIPSLIVNVVIWLITAFVVGNLRSDPGENKYGPPPAAKASAA